MIQKLVKEGKKGNINSKEKLLEKLKPLIITSIEKYYFGKEHWEDLIQLGYLTILEGVEEYDFKRKVPFLGFIKVKLKYTYMNLDTYDELSLNEELEGGNELIDLIESKEKSTLERFLEKESYVKLYRAMEKLTEREGEIIALYYIKGYSMVQIKDILDISYRTVVNIKTNGIRRLKRELINDVEK